jgi:hypothetical protein
MSCESLALAAHARRNEYLAIALTLLGLTLSLTLGLMSDGYYMDDDLTHYRFAADAWHDVTALLHRWARPGFNFPMALAARLGGIAGCRILSALMTAGAAYLAWRIARRILGPTTWATLVPLLVWVQPMVFKLSLTMLTETPALLYLTAGIWLYLRGNRIIGCALLSLLFITRDETMAMAPLMAVAVLYDAWRLGGRSFRKAFTTGWVWGCAGALAWAVAAYWFSALWVDLPPDGSPLEMFSREYTHEYGRGSWLHYVGIWPDAAGMGVLMLALGGAIWFGRRAWLISAWVFGLVGLHTLIFAMGLFASGGYSRFLVPIGGLAAVLSAGGLQAVFAHHRRNLMAIMLLGAAIWLPVTAWVVWTQWSFNLWAWLIPPAIVCVLAAITLAVVRNDKWRRVILVGAVVIAAGLQVGRLAPEVKPLRLTDLPMYRALLTARDRAAADYADNLGYCQHVFLQHYRENTEPIFSNEHAIDVWQQAQPGTLYFWENQYALKPHEPETTQRLLDELQRLGTRIVEVRGEPYYTFVPVAIVQVYVRDATPADAPPALPLSEKTSSPIASETSFASE